MDRLLFGDVRSQEVRVEAFKKAVTLDNEIEAELADTILCERGIPHIMRSYHDRAYDGLFQGPRGWGFIEAPEGLHEEIRAVVADIKRQSHFSDTELGGGELDGSP
jgi:hypothetical protein